MLYSGTDPKSHITEYTLVYGDNTVGFSTLNVVVTLGMLTCIGRRQVLNLGFDTTGSERGLVIDRNQRGNHVQGYLAHQKQRPPSTVQ